MTFRSTEAHMDLHRRSGRLHLFEPELGHGEAYRRRLWLHPKLSQWICSQGETKQEKRYFDEVRGFLKSFVAGRDFEDDVKLKKLYTDYGAWYEIRIIFNPHHRIIGGFLRPGEFVALMHDTRANLDRKGFSAAISQAAKIWKTLSFPNQPLTADRLSLLENFEHDED